MLNKNKQPSTKAGILLILVIFSIFGLGFITERNSGMVEITGGVIGVTGMAVGGQYELSPANIEKIMDNLEFEQKPPDGLGNGIYKSNYGGKVVYIKFEGNGPVRIIASDNYDDWRDLVDGDAWSNDDIIYIDTNLYGIEATGDYSQTILKATFEDAKKRADSKVRDIRIEELKKQNVDIDELTPAQKTQLGIADDSDPSTTGTSSLFTSRQGLLIEGLPTIDPNVKKYMFTLEDGSTIPGEGIDKDAAKINAQSKLAPGVEIIETGKDITATLTTDKVYEFEVQGGGKMRGGGVNEAAAKIDAQSNLARGITITGTGKDITNTIAEPSKPTNQLWSSLTEEQQAKAKNLGYNTHAWNKLISETANLEYKKAYIGKEVDIDIIELKLKGKKLSEQATYESLVDKEFNEKKRIEIIAVIGVDPITGKELSEIEKAAKIGELNVKLQATTKSRLDAYKKLETAKDTYIEHNLNDGTARDFADSNDETEQEMAIRYYRKRALEGNEAESKAAQKALSTGKLKDNKKAQEALELTIKDINGKKSVKNIEGLEYNEQIHKFTYKNKLGDTFIIEGGNIILKNEPKSKDTPEKQKEDANELITSSYKGDRDLEWIDGNYRSKVDGMIYSLTPNPDGSGWLTHTNGRAPTSIKVDGRTLKPKEGYKTEGGLTIYEDSATKKIYTQKYGIGENEEDKNENSKPLEEGVLIKTTSYGDRVKVEEKLNIEKGKIKTEPTKTTLVGMDDNKKETRTVINPLIKENIESALKKAGKNVVLSGNLELGNSLTINDDKGKEEKQTIITRVEESKFKFETDMKKNSNEDFKPTNIVTIDENSKEQEIKSYDTNKDGKIDEKDHPDGIHTTHQIEIAGKNGKFDVDDAKLVVITYDQSEITAEKGEVAIEKVLYDKKTGEPLEASKPDGQGGWVEDEERTKTLQTRWTSKKWFENLEFKLIQYRGLSGISQLIFSDETLAEWREGVDKVFSSAYLGTEYWTSGICSKYIPKDSKGTLTMKTKDGLFDVIAHVEGEKTTTLAPNGTAEYIYKLTFSVRNPKGSRYDKLEFNVYLSGDQTVKLYETDIKVDEDDSFNRGSGKVEDGQTTYDKQHGKPIVQYSNYNYNQICIKFKDSIINAEGDSEDEICNSIVEYQGDPTKYQQQGTGTIALTGEGGEEADF